MAPLSPVRVLIGVVATLSLMACGLVLDEQARFERARSAYESGDHAAAIVDLKALLQEAPNRADARLMLGDALYRAGDLLAAAEEMERGVTLLREQTGDSGMSPLLLESTAKVAALQLATRRFDQALVNADLLIQADQNNITGYVIASQAAYYAGDNQTARQRASALLDRQPDDPLAHAMVGFVDAREGSFTDAEAHFNRALAEKPDQHAVRLALTQVQIVMGAPASALATLAPLLVLQPRDPRLFQLVDLMDLRGSDVRQRVEQIALEVEGAHVDSPIPDILRGRMLLLAGEHAIAADRFEAAMAKDGGRYPTIGRFLAQRASGASGAAVETLRAWVDANAQDQGAAFLLATAYLDSGDTERARTEFERLAEVEEDSPLVLNNLAWLYGEVNDPRAVEMARRAHDLAPNNGAITDTLGWLLVRSGQTQEGIRMLRLAAEQAPGVEEIRYHLALALAEDGATEDAQRELADILPSGPDAAPSE